jgi:hypothetical protein
VHGLAALRDGSLAVVGDFTTAGGAPANRAARWTGTAWQALGAGADALVSAVHELADGDLLVGGRFASIGGVAADAIARWNAGAWSAVGAGVTGSVQAFARRADGQVAIGGAFGGANGQASTGFAWLVSTCAATVAAGGTGCPGSGGGNDYAARNLPWTGGTYRLRATGLPAFAFAVVVTGFSAANVPLALALPPSPAACTLRVSPDLTEVAVVAGGALDVQLALPDSPALVGLVLRQQLVLMEVNAQLQFVQNTVSNALTATVGMF